MIVSEPIIVYKTIDDEVKFLYDLIINKVIPYFDKNESGQFNHIQIKVKVSNMNKANIIIKKLKDMSYFLNEKSNENKLFVPEPFFLSANVSEDDLKKRYDDREWFNSQKTIDVSLFKDNNGSRKKTYMLKSKLAKEQSKRKKMKQKCN